MIRNLLAVGLVLFCVCTPFAPVLPTACAEFTYTLDFEQPMSWADDISPRGLNEVQNWEIADGGTPGKALRISAAVYKQPTSLEVRTLQFNHKPDTHVRVSLDIRAACAPAGSRFVIRYFDGYCGAFPFLACEQDEYLSIPKALWDSRNEKLTSDWQHLSFELGKLKRTVLTIAFIVEQPKAVEGQYIEYYIDNLKVEATLLDQLMDPHFEWHGNGGRNTVEFRFNTMGADADWCDFADQEVAKNWQNKDIHFTLMHMRDSSTKPEVGIGYQIMHEPFSDDTAGDSVIAMSKYQHNSAASWGVRQTVSYAALGLEPDQKAVIRLTIKVTNVDVGNQQMTRVQAGVDPSGGIVTRSALWSKECYADFRKEGWQLITLDFTKPKGARGFTVYFRHRDGKPASKEKIDPYEEQSSGTSPFARGFADYVHLKVLSKVTP